MLYEIGASEVPELLVVNKMDRTRDAALVVAERHPGALAVSAYSGEGIDKMKRAMGDLLRVADRVVELLVPFERGDVLAAVHREGEVVGESLGEGATVVQVVLDEAGRARFEEFAAS